MGGVMGKTNRARYTLEARCRELELCDEVPEMEAEWNRIGDRLAELDQITEQGTYQLEDMARAGALVTLTYTGALRIERGLVRPEDCQNEEEEPGKTGAEEPEGQGTPVLKHSAALTEDLTAQKPPPFEWSLRETPTLPLPLWFTVSC